MGGPATFAGTNHQAASAAPYRPDRRFLAERYASLVK